MSLDKFLGECDSQLTKCKKTNTVYGITTRRVAILLRIVKEMQSYLQDTKQIKCKYCFNYEIIKSCLKKCDEISEE